MPRALLSIVFLSSFLTAGFPTAGASAQELSESDREAAREHFERGSLAFERGDYAEASVEFRAAYGLTHHADLLYNIYSARERNGELQEAAEALEGYLRDSDPQADRREALELRLERLRLRIDQARLEAAEANVQAERERERAAEELEAEQAERAAAEARAGAERAQRLMQAHSAHQTSENLFVAGLAIMTAGALALVSFGVFAGLSESEDQSLAGSCGSDSGRYCTEDDVQTLRSFNTAADVSLFSGLGLAAVGAAIIGIGEGLRPSSDTPTVSVQPLVAPAGAGALLRGRW